MRFRGIGLRTHQETSETWRRLRLILTLTFIAARLLSTQSTNVTSFVLDVAFVLE